MILVAIQAVDWAMHSAQVSSTYDFDMIHGLLVGFLVQETDEYVAITQQWFSSGEVRQTISIPKVCIQAQWRIDLEEFKRLANEQKQS